MQRPKKRRAISEIYPRFIDTGMTGPYENPCPAATTEPSANAPPSRPGANYRPRKSALTDRANLARCLLLAAGAAAVVALSWLLGHLVPPTR